MLKVLHGARLWLNILALCGGLLLSTLETSIIATALISIATSLGDFAQSNWVVVSYLLTYTAFMVIFARISDIFGRKLIFLFSLLLFVVFSLACGLAEDITTLIVFRAFQGIGGSGIYSLVMSCIPEISPPDQFGYTSGAISAVFASSSILGPIVGGAITSSTSWRWVFWLNLPAGGFVILLALVVFPNDFNNRDPTKTASMKSAASGPFRWVSGKFGHVSSTTTNTRPTISKPTSMEPLAPSADSDEDPPSSRYSPSSSARPARDDKDRSSASPDSSPDGLAEKSRRADPESLSSLAEAPHEDEKPSRWSKWATIDFPGAALLLAASILIVFAIESGGKQYAWSSAPVVATLAAGGVLWIAFSAWVSWLSRTSRQASGRMIPIFPAYLVKQRVIGFAFLTAFLCGFPFMTVIIYLPQRFQIENGLTPTRAGIEMLPLLLLSALGSGISGALCSKKNVAPYILIIANALQVLGLGLLSSLPYSDGIRPEQYAYQAILGLGFGLALSALIILCKVQVTEKDLAVTMGATTQVRVFGGVIGVAVAQLTLSSRLETDLQGVFSAAGIDAVMNDPDSVARLPDFQRSRVREIYSDGFSEQTKIVMFIAIAALVSSVLAFQRHPPSLAASAEDHQDSATSVESESVDDPIKPSGGAEDYPSVTLNGTHELLRPGKRSSILSSRSYHFSDDFSEEMHQAFPRRAGSRRSQRASALLSHQAVDGPRSYLELRDTQQRELARPQLQPEGRRPSSWFNSMVVAMSWEANSLPVRDSYYSTRSDTDVEPGQERIAAAASVASARGFSQASTAVTPDAQAQWSDSPYKRVARPDPRRMSVRSGSTLTSWGSSHGSADAPEAVQDTVAPLPAMARTTHSSRPPRHPFRQTPPHGPSPTAPGRGSTPMRHPPGRRTQNAASNAEARVNEWPMSVIPALPEDAASAYSRPEPGASPYLGAPTLTSVEQQDRTRPTRQLRFSQSASRGDATAQQQHEATSVGEYGRGSRPPSYRQNWI